MGIFNQIIGRQRDAKGRFVKGNKYRIMRNKAGAAYYPNGWTLDGKCYNVAFDIKAR